MQVRMTKQHRTWIVAATLLIAIGVVESVVAANSILHASEGHHNVQGEGLWGEPSAVGFLIGGIAISVLLGALIYVLGTGRARSRSLVELRTDELQFQALHDALTGLPNRALIMDRMEQLLARGRRNGTVGAVLYLDLDDFKNINDSLGHEAGDRLLEAVAWRLAGTLRGSRHDRSDGRRRVRRVDRRE